MPQWRFVCANLSSEDVAAVFSLSLADREALLFGDSDDLFPGLWDRITDLWTQEDERLEKEG
jgi:hypothetical protein